MEAIISLPIGWITIASRLDAESLNQVFFEPNDHVQQGTFLCGNRHRIAL
jgi:hypothetical protein